MKGTIRICLPEKDHIPLNKIIYKCIINTHLHKQIRIASRCYGLNLNWNGIKRIRTLVNSIIRRIRKRQEMGNVQMVIE